MKTNTVRVANRAEGSINILVHPVWVACIKPVSWVWSYTVMNAYHQEQTICVYLSVSVGVISCDYVSVYLWTHMLTYSVYELHYVSKHCEKWKRKQVKLILWKSALATEALQEGVIGTVGNLIQGDSHSLLALGQPLFCWISALCP